LSIHSRDREMIEIVVACWTQPLKMITVGGGVEVGVTDVSFTTSLLNKYIFCGSETSDEQKKCDIFSDVCIDKIIYAHLIDFLISLILLETFFQFRHKKIYFKKLSLQQIKLSNILSLYKFVFISV
jgi:hypothetical protein